MSRGKKSLLTTLMLLVGGCALSPGDSHQSIQYYDFGPATQESALCRVYAQLDTVTASAALQGSRIWYRYSDKPYAPAPFAVSRWSAPPGDLLRRQLSARFASSPDNGTVAIELLRLELLVQPDGVAAVSMETLTTHYRADGTNNKQHYFRGAQPSQASPAGAARAAGLAVREFELELCQWLPQPMISHTPLDTEPGLLEAVRED